eukprot:6627741-Pyramimonas_sp.AAC.1
MGFHRAPRGAGLGSKNAPQALRLLPPAARVGRNLDDHVRLRDVDGVVAHLRVRTVDEKGTSLLSMVDR